MNATMTADQLIAKLREMLAGQTPEAIDAAAEEVGDRLGLPFPDGHLIVAIPAGVLSVSQVPGGFRVAIITSPVGAGAIRHSTTRPPDVVIDPK